MQSNTVALHRKEKLRKDRFIIGWMVACHALAILALGFISTKAVVTFGVMYAVTVLGITFGFHRLFTHRSFKAAKWVEYVAAVAGTLAMQGTVFEWVAHHRMHHAFSDTDKDPHNARRGFWWSHLGWMLFKNPVVDSEEKLKRFGRDISADPFLSFLSRSWVMPTMQILLGIAFWVFGGFDVMLWGIFVRLVAVYHVTWLVNSASHMWGYRNYEVDDLATNCWWVGLLAFGEGWHNNHHAHGNVAPAGHKWWEFDITWQVIKVLRFFGQVSDVKLPPAWEPEVQAVAMTGTTGTV